MDKLHSHWQDEKSLSLLVLTSLLALALSVLYPTWHRHRQTRLLSRQHGCQEPTRYPHQDRGLGSDLARIRTEAMKAGRLFKLYDSHFELYDKTFEENARGHRLVNTIEPANIQQITSIAVSDYGKDLGRTKAQAPFLGPSIFSDGLVWKHARALVTPTFKRAEISDIDQLALFADSFLDLIPGDGIRAVAPIRRALVSSPKGTTVVMGTWCVHHSKEIWGDDVNEYKPDRWIGYRPGWEFVPFLGGPRTCPAQQQVLTHAVYILVRMTQTFVSIENRDPVFEYIEKFAMGFESRNGVKAAFKEA